MKSGVDVVGGCLHAARARQLEECTATCKAWQPSRAPQLPLPPHAAPHAAHLHAAPPRDLVQRRAPGLILQQRLHQPDDERDLQGGPKCAMA